MTIANQIKSLGEDIEVSYGARVANVSDIIEETQAFLGNYHRSHQKMASHLRDFLSSDSSTRVSEVRQMRVNNVKDLKEMEQELAEFLSAAEKERIEEFTSLIGEIRRAVEAIGKDTAKILADFRSNHRQMSQAQRAELVKITKERIKEVSAKLSGFGREHQAVAQQLWEELSAFQKKLARGVSLMRAPVIADLKEAKRNWENLTKVMAAKRAGKSIPKPQAAMGVPTAVKEVAEETFATGELKEKVLKVIQAHPGGITLAEIGGALGVAHIRISKPIKYLLAEMVVTKRDSEYFPT